VKNPESQSFKQIVSSFSANAVLEALERDTTDSPNIRVRYYSKDVDGDEIKNAFKKYNYNFSIGKANLKEIKTNAIFVGPNVPIKDIQGVVLILIRAGVEIKSIQRYNYWRSEKASMIQIGSSKQSIEKAAIGINEIASINKLEKLIEVIDKAP